MYIMEIMILWFDELFTDFCTIHMQSWVDYLEIVVQITW